MRSSDVHFDVIEGTRARQALGVLDRLGCPMPPFTVYIPPLTEKFLEQVLTNKYKILYCRSARQHLIYSIYFLMENNFHLLSLKW